MCVPTHRSAHNPRELRYYSAAAAMYGDRDGARGYDKLEKEKRDEKRGWPEGVAIVATRTEILRSLSDPPVLGTFETE